MDREKQEREKKLAAEHAVSYIQDGMIVGLGTGSTSAYMIEKLGEKVTQGLVIQAIASSDKTADQARKLGIPLTSLEQEPIMDINIDGADEFDRQFRLIKGGGGALLREKILAYNAKLNIIIADSSKQVEQLGGFKLPIEVIPFAAKSIAHSLEQMGLKPLLRLSNNKFFTTDENNWIIDTDISGREDLDKLSRELIDIPGVVETGLFLTTTDIIIIGKNTQVVTLQNT